MTSPYYFYPDTTHSGWIGHLFELDPTQDCCDGSIYCNVLQDVTGQCVPCWTSHATCNAKEVRHMLSSWRKQCHIGQHYGGMVVGHPMIPIKPNQKLCLWLTGRVGGKHGMSNKMSTDMAKYPRSLVKILAMEEDAKTLGFCPSSHCTVVTNHTSICLKCCE
ncbi:hypothetical protein PAXRUDRAFT_35967 [Paxillus rubicundulus Ve08.2h10]|uniref:Uncharacterized protein n=1 Tax=Paxillus rubicundulus Ve08.2h10 TaxID=930991 RepID=A0A0D0DAW2_9AGAM|nr:hypothetical protein PAXRUDRAFT_35967 [Paxillus rubicundulus Ve08.2h10]